VGVDLGYRLTPSNKLSGGWDYSDTSRERIDFEETQENKLYAEWKNTSFDSLSTRIKYQYLQRRSEFGYGSVNPAANANNFFNYNIRRFDLNDVDQNQVRFVADWNPVPLLDLGGELILKDNQYKDVPLGRTHDNRQEVYLTASYGDPKRFRVTTFFDYEHTHYDSTHQQGNPQTAPVCSAPCDGPAGRFVWIGTVRDKNYVAGVAADWPFREWLKFKGALIWQQTDGTADFLGNPAFYTPQNIAAYDSFRKTTLNLSGTYAIDKRFDVTFGYAYEKYDNDDAQLDGYNYTQGGNYLSGAYANSSYNANIFYMTLKYKLF
jgi:hypothetical protein